MGAFLLQAEDACIVGIEARATQLIFPGRLRSDLAPGLGIATYAVLALWE
jgi:hypothetical protein